MLCKLHLGAIIILVLVLPAIAKLQPTLLLTNSTNKHTSQILILKMTDDCKTVFSVDNTGVMKVWDFGIPNLVLRQTININGSFY